MLVVMIGIRKSLDMFFTQRELKILDDIMPEMTKRRADGDDDLRGLDEQEMGCCNRILSQCIGKKIIK